MATALKRWDDLTAAQKIEAAAFAAEGETEERPEGVGVLNEEFGDASGEIDDYADGGYPSSIGEIADADNSEEDDIGEDPEK